MNVKLAVQLFRSTLSNIPREYGSPGTAGTSTFFLMMDQFFDIMNTRNTTGTVRDRKAFTAPCTSVDNAQLSLLKDKFLKYSRVYRKMPRSTGELLWSTKIN